MAISHQFILFRDPQCSTLYVQHIQSRAPWTCTEKRKDQIDFSFDSNSFRIELSRLAIIGVYNLHVNTRNCISLGSIVAVGAVDVNGMLHAACYNCDVQWKPKPKTTVSFWAKFARVFATFSVCKTNIANLPSIQNESPSLNCLW